MDVVDRGNDRIQKFDSNGKFVTAWGSHGTANGQLNKIQDIGVYPCGHNLYVADSGNNRIQMFDSNGKFLRKWGSNGTGSGQFYYPEGIGVDSRQGNVYVADTGNNRIQLFNDYGKFNTTWGSPGTANGQFNKIKDTGHLKGNSNAICPFNSQSPANLSVRLDGLIYFR